MIPPLCLSSPRRRLRRALLAPTAGALKDPKAPLAPRASARLDTPSQAPSLEAVHLRGQLFGALLAVVPQEPEDERRAR